MFRNLIVLAFIVLLLAFGVLYQNYKKSGPTGKLIETLDEWERDALIIKNLKQFEDVQKFSFNDYEVDRLDEREIPYLLTMEPLIYSGLPIGTYKVELKGDGQNLLVFYDLEQNTILKKFNVLAPQFG